MALERFGVSMDEDLLDKFDALIAGKGYTNRSEAIRDLIRRDLVADACETGDLTGMGVATIVYDHHQRELAAKLMDLQHDAKVEVVCTTHVHLDHENCLEVILIRGEIRPVRDLASRLAGLRGVKHGSTTFVAGYEDI